MVNPEHFVAYLSFDCVWPFLNSRQLQLTNYLLTNYSYLIEGNYCWENVFPILRTEMQRQIPNPESISKGSTGKAHLRVSNKYNILLTHVHVYKSLTFVLHNSLRLKNMTFFYQTLYESRQYFKNSHSIDRI